LAVAVFANEAKAAIAGSQMAVARTKVADDPLCVGFIAMPPAADSRAVGQSGHRRWGNNNLRHGGSRESGGKINSEMS
jgi:hypothetical protein